MFLCIARKRLGVCGLAVIGALLIWTIFYWTHTRYIDLLSRIRLLEALQGQFAMLTATVERLRSDVNVLNSSRVGIRQKIQVLQASYVTRDAPERPSAPESSSPLLHPSVNLVPSSPSSPLPYKDCVPLPRAKRAGTKICIYPSTQDVWISGSLKKGSLWEGDLVSEMLKAMETESDIQLLDLGANIGVFTLSAASAGHDVLAVDMMPGNVHLLQTSLSESQLGSKVTLVNNAVYSNHTSMGVVQYTGNVGGTGLDLKNPTKKGEVVKTICMDDLVPLLTHRKVYVKMDIEMAELKALSCSYKFFQQVDVRFLQMEWAHRSKQEAEWAEKFFTEHGMKPSRRASAYLPVNIGQVYNVFFICQS